MQLVIEHWLTAIVQMMELIVANLKFGDGNHFKIARKIIIVITTIFNMIKH